MTFKVIKSKTCRNHLKKWYELPTVVNDDFLETFDFLGEPEFTDMRKFMPASLVLFRLRSDSFQVELSGGCGGNEVFAILPKADSKTEMLIEETLQDWLQKQ